MLREYHGKQTQGRSNTAENRCVVPEGWQHSDSCREKEVVLKEGRTAWELLFSIIAVGLIPGTENICPRLFIEGTWGSCLSDTRQRLRSAVAVTSGTRQYIFRTAANIETVDIGFWLHPNSCARATEVVGL